MSGSEYDTVGRTHHLGTRPWSRFAEQWQFNEAGLSERIDQRGRSAAPQQRRPLPPAAGERRRSGLRARRRLGDQIFERLQLVGRDVGLGGLDRRAEMPGVVGPEEHDAAAVAGHGTAQK